jgi:hypothetical protein
VVISTFLEGPVSVITLGRPLLHVLVRAMYRKLFQPLQKRLDS